MTEYDRTTAKYVTGDNEAMVKFFQDLRRGLRSFIPISTRDGRGGEVISGIKRKEPDVLTRAFGAEYLIQHERAIEDIRTMRERGMLISPFPKTMKPERISGGNYEDGISHVDSIRKTFDAWFKFCEDNHKHARAATILVFGEGMNFIEASRVMRANGLRANHRTMEGQCRMGIHQYEIKAREIRKAEKKF